MSARGNTWRSFVPAEGSSDYTLAIGVGFPQDWAGKVRIHSDEGILGMALQKKMVVSKMDPHSSSGRRSPIAEIPP